MNIQEIDKGTAANNGTGTPARTAADIINNNFASVVANVRVKIGDYFVDKNGNTDLDNLEVGDRFEGWLETDTRYVVGKIIALPFDVDDDTKVRLAINNYI